MTFTLNSSALSYAHLDDWVKVIDVAIGMPEAYAGDAEAVGELLPGMLLNEQARTIRVVISSEVE